jgi:glyoxylase-like metal-dependent hydrolase (beta-lactamase superfamily II)
MERWMRTLVPRELSTPPSLDRLVQFDRPGKGALGYMLVSDGEALLVDPPRQTEVYLAVARAAGARIIAVADTHVHADYISGAPALALSLEVPYYLHPADAVYPYDGTPGRLSFESLRDGASVRVGRAEVRVVHTPGHTVGSVTYTVDDAVALTGDFVFVASIGRPDLAGKTEQWTKWLWHSLERAKQEWDPDIMIYPAHYAFEAERQSDHAVAGRFGDILEQSEPLQIQSKAAFTDWVMSRKRSFPEVYRRIKAINVGLEVVDDIEADVLEMGKNECALG